MTLQALALSLFTAVMAVAAFEDFRRLKIPNLLPLLLCAAWPLYVAAVPIPGGIVIGAVGVALAVFLASALLFARGWLGGGDVKLLSAATLWAGAPQTFGLLAATGVLGGVLALILVSPLGRYASSARSWLGQPAIADPTASPPVPYGVAIAGASVIVVVSPHIA
ncbi:MAG: prepilin peptidase [Alphaproteobacteria bacterium]